ncbi:MAG: hypothetical protein Rubg2KO_33150 [Rubricoccaceae bacterium]
MMMTWMRASVALLVVGLWVFIPQLALSRSTGAPSGFAGDIVPGGEPTTCAVCHTGRDLNDPQGGGSIIIDAPGSAVPGETITISITLVNNTPQVGSEKRQGFLATLKNPADSLFVGGFTLPDPSLLQQASGNEAYVTHTTAGNKETTWTFQWTAPSTDVPSEVVIYTAGNAANGSGLGGDFIYTDTHTVSLAGVAVEEGPSADSGMEWASLYPNPVRSSARAELVLDSPMHAEIRLVDGRGRLVRAVASGMRPEGVSTVEVDVRGVAAGTYFLVAETEAGRRTQAVSVVR